MIPICDLKRQYQSLKPEIDEALLSAVAESRYILGPNVRALEEEIAEYCKCDNAIGVNSGTDALHLALRALDVGPGDEVITTPFTFVATTEAIGIVGATPVFVDIDPNTFNMDVTQIESCINENTKAILPVHLYGQPCDMDAIMDIARRHNLFVIEDCAQAIGATWRGKPVGSFGDAGCLSFFPSKNLGCFGDGGMVVTNNTQVFEQVEMLRRHGGRVKYHHEVLGLNSRLDELQAAVLRVKLQHLDNWIDCRRNNAYRYNNLFAECAGVTCPSERTGRGTVVPTDGENDLLKSVYHQYTLLVTDRDGVQQSLQDEGIGAMVYYPIPLHLQEVHADLGYRRGSFPQAEAAADSCISIPMFPELTSAEQDAVVAAVTKVTTSQSQTPQLRRAA